ncbi:DUF3006 domain-containing protein [Alteribacillus bidgolensis]|uniref:DUF3006 domain-containing protein n=1 Tax=Alteribacillus bidgolensis TaxID=930129 RepID=A0A1G8SAW8_9BACI|nr:DUF3006 domain-containing protein [Alteribacillus bidgolensis]SDJ26334.1 Protein of unknown function [Alteribacillus bidgolensis]
MEKYTIDRFEGELAVLLHSGDETVQKDVLKSQLPDGVKQGDVLEIIFKDNDTVKKAVIKEDETESKKAKAKSLLEKLKNKK